MYSIDPPATVTACIAINRSVAMMDLFGSLLQRPSRRRSAVRRRAASTRWRSSCPAPPGRRSALFQSSTASVRSSRFRPAGARSRCGRPPGLRVHAASSNPCSSTFPGTAGRPPADRLRHRGSPPRPNACRLPQPGLCGPRPRAAADGPGMHGIWEEPAGGVTPADPSYSADAVYWRAHGSVLDELSVVASPSYTGDCRGLGPRARGISRQLVQSFRVEPAQRG